MPKASSRRRTNDRYTWALMKLDPPDGVKSVRTRTAFGSTSQASSTPPTNSGTAAATNDRARRRSFLCRPGTMNAQSWYSQTGLATMRPRNTDTWIIRSKELATPSKFRVACRPSCSLRSRIGLISAASIGW